MTGVYSIQGKKIKDITLPSIFNTEYRPDLIQRAVVALQSQHRQPYGTHPLAGMQTSAAYFGRRRGAYRVTINRGMSRLPREKLGGGGLGRVLRVPQAVGGRRAHPPKVEKKFEKKINKKEYKLALNSAIAATSKREIVAGRGHVIEDVKELPLIVEDKIKELNKTKEALEVLSALGVGKDLERAKQKTIRAGRGKLRGRKYKRKKSVLMVVDEDGGIKKALSNVPGVDVRTPETLTVEDLACGGHAGRLTIWSLSALQKLESLENESL